jgi:hypothetical protein
VGVNMPLGVLFTFLKRVWVLVFHPDPENGRFEAEIGGSR